MEDRSSRRARLVMIVGIMLAVLAGVGAFVVGSGSQSSAPPVVETTPVVVATRELARLTALAAADVKVEQYPVTLAPVGALKDPKEAREVQEAKEVQETGQAGAEAAMGVAEVVAEVADLPEAVEMRPHGWAPGQVSRAF